LTFTYQETTSGFGSLTKFKAVSIPQEIGTPELEFDPVLEKNFKVLIPVLEIRLSSE
jgi:hypothetical protein